MAGRKALAAVPFFLFLQGLALDAKCRHRASFQSLKGNFTSATLANTIGIGRNTIQRFVDLLEESLLSLLQPQLKVMVDLRRRLVAQIWKHFNFLSVGQDVTDLTQQRSPLTFEIGSDALVLVSRTPFRFGSQLGGFGDALGHDAH